VKLLVVALLLIPLSISLGQSRKTGSSPGSIEGDAYLTFLSGETKQAAGQRVFLLPADDSLYSEVSRFCRFRASEMDALDSALKANGRADLDSILRATHRMMGRQADSVAAIVERHSIASAPTGMHAHFRFATVRPDFYIMYAEWQVDQHSHRWWAPVRVDPGQHVERDLSSENAADQGLDCKR
jgi:hypothetical protein